MTNEEAIEHIKWLHVFAHNGDDRDAIDMAIRALQYTEFEYEGKIYRLENPILKTKDKEGFCSFYGFKEVKT